MDIDPEHIIKNNAVAIKGTLQAFLLYTFYILFTLKTSIAFYIRNRMIRTTKDPEMGQFLVSGSLHV